MRQINWWQIYQNLSIDRYDQEGNTFCKCRNDLIIESLKIQNLSYKIRGNRKIVFRYCQHRLNMTRARFK